MCEERKVGIVGLGKYLPDSILTNAELERKIDTSDEWITQRTGIKERRIAREDEATSDMALAAAENAIKNAKIKPNDLNLIIVATITPDMFFPSTACILQKRLRIDHIPAFDINVACSGFIYGIALANQFIKTGTYKYVLVVGAEKMSSVTDWSDRSTCVLMGDGAGAAILGEVKEGGILSVYLGADGSKGDLLKMPAGGSRIPASIESVQGKLHYLKMQGNELFKHAVKIMANAALKATMMLQETEPPQLNY